MRLRFTKGKWQRYSGYENIKKATSGRSRYLLEKLNSFMDENSPQAARFIANLYENQRNAITYRELCEAIISGDIDIATLRAWQEDYSRFVEKHLKPMWAEAMKAHARLLEEQHNGFFYDPVQERVQSWIDKNGARWVTNQTEETQKAVRSMLCYATTGGFSTDELSRVIRPAIGLTQMQAKASVNYYKNVRDKLLKDNPNMKPATAQKKAREAQLKYNARQHRYRADTIAQTELAYAYNRGMHEAIWQAQVQGYMGAMVKRWLTARNAEVCEMCMDLDGTIIEMEQKFDLKSKELFSGAHETPPAHPRCRCVVEYLEMSSPEVQEWLRQSREVKTPYGDNAGLNIKIDRPDYMSSSFKPRYGTKSELTVDNRKLQVKSVTNSSYTVYTDVGNNRRNKAVRLTEKTLNNISTDLPIGFIIPQIAIIDFEQNKLKSTAIAAYDKTTDTIFYNSSYNTVQKVMDYVTQEAKFFANQTEAAPLLHEMGHKYYYSCIKNVAKSENVSYNKAEAIIKERIFNYIHTRNNDGFFLYKNISKYADIGYTVGNYGEIIAECFSVRKTNTYAREIIKLLGGDGL